MRAAWQAKHHPFLVAGKTPPFPLRHHLHCTPDVTHTRARARVQYAAATTTTTTTTTKIKVIKFTWARSRLPLTAGTFSSRFTITCFFQIDLPCYTSKQALREKLLCVSFFLSFIYESQTIIISFVLE